MSRNKRGNVQNERLSEKRQIRQIQIHIPSRTRHTSVPNGIILSTLPQTETATESTGAKAADA